MAVKAAADRANLPEWVEVVLIVHAGPDHAGTGEGGCLAADGA